MWDILRNPDGPEAAALIRRMADELRKAGEYVDIEAVGERVMKLWHISQEQHDSYDTFDSAVVAAETAELAAKIHPFGKVWPDWRDGPYPCWATDWQQVTVKEIGEASEGVSGVICASFNAG